MAVQTDGKIVVVGQGVFVGTAMARYNADGTLDTGFGAGGKVTTADFAANGVVLQPDGKILVVGTSSIPEPGGVSGFIDRLAMARYNPDGSLDATFGTAGEVALPSMAVNTLSNPRLQAGVTLQSDGRITVAGANFIVLRDTTFY